ncbi:hypothetical protein [Sodalis sp. RH22]|uniref:hypothetical protein n=1 Tax=unclassified Sodalis (in: enterobacteria) TaxID=2636512 RepID=UPI0039B6670F
MKVKIVGVIGKGDFGKETVTMQVLEDCDIVKYVIFDNTYKNNGNISDKYRHSYWFPSKKVKAGDVVTLLTQTGKNTETKLPDGTPVHMFYWNLREAVWNDDGDIAVLLEIADGQAFHVK